MHWREQSSKRTNATLRDFHEEVGLENKRRAFALVNSKATRALEASSASLALHTWSVNDHGARISLNKRAACAGTGGARSIDVFIYRHGISLCHARYESCVASSVSACYRYTVFIETAISIDST
jgi:hypothetical protein